MRALLDDAALVHDEDQVGMADGGQAVRDEEGGAPAQQALDGVLDELLGAGVDGAGGLVQHEDARIAQHGAGEGDQLLFAGGEAVAALADVGEVAAVELVYDGVGGDGLGGGADLLVGGVQAAVADVVHDRAGEEVRVLQHIADGGVQPQLGALAVVAPVDEDAAGRGLKEAAGEIDERGLARAGLADDGDGGAGGDLQVEVGEHVLLAVGIAEGDVLKLDVAADGLPVFADGMEAVAVAGDDLGRVDDEGLLVEQSGDALDVGLHADEVGEHAGQALDGLEDAHGIGEEGGERADHHAALGGDEAALHEHGGGREAGQARDERNVHGGQARGAHGAVLHLRGQGVKVATVLLFDDERLAGLGAHDALVVGAGDARVRVADAAVPGENAALEQHGQHGDGGHDEQHDEREAQVEQGHGAKDAQHVEQRPDDVKEVPGDEAGDAVGVVHDAREDVAHGRHVVVGEGQALQVREARALHVAAQAHLDAHGAAGEAEHGERLHEDDAHAEQEVAADAVGGAADDEAVDGVALQQRQDDVDQRAHDVEREYDEQQRAKGA